MKKRTRVGTAGQTSRKNNRPLRAVDEVQIVPLSCMEYPPGSGNFYATVRVRAHIPLPTGTCQMYLAQTQIFDRFGGNKTGVVSLDREPTTPTQPDPNWYRSGQLSFSVQSGEKVTAKVDAYWRRPEEDHASATSAPCS